jgi:hypothetical protein
MGRRFSLSAVPPPPFGHPPRLRRGEELETASVTSYPSEAGMGVAMFVMRYTATQPLSWGSSYLSWDQVKRTMVHHSNCTRFAVHIVAARTQDSPPRRDGCYTDRVEFVLLP